MASRQGLALAGGAVAAIGGYYLYNAGGSARVAEKQMEYDAARVGNKMGVSGGAKELSTGAQLSGAQIGHKVDDAIERAKLETNKLSDQLSQKYNEATSQLNSLEKQAEAKWEQAKAEAASKLSGLQKDVTATLEEKKKDAATYAASTMSSLQKDAEQKYKEAQVAMEDARKETGTKLAQAVDVVDRKTDEGAAKTKSGIFSWFGSK